MEDRRRLAAIMFTDLVGSTAAAQADEAGALRRLAEQEQLLRGCFRAFGGREIKATGDGFLVEFESALRAVQCAAEAQRQFGERNSRSAQDPLRIRIGIHLGDVEHRDGDIFGDAVNLAARVEPLAEPGGLCVTGQVYDQIRGKVPYDFESLGPVPLKGVREAEVVYRVRLEADGSSGVASTPPGQRMAVLPLANMSPESKDEYFSDGMTEEIIAALARLPGLSVISRTSVMQYKQQPKRLAEIARELKVTHVLEGSVRKAGNRVRITVQLIDAPADRHLWADSFDRGLEDVFSIQTEIAAKVASALQIRLLEDGRAVWGRAPTRDPLAHELFLKGRAVVAGSAVSLVTALGYFEAARQLDPGFALAHAWLAVAYHSLGFFESLPSRRAFALAEELARKSIELDPSAGEGHVILARVLADTRRPDEAARELQLVLRLTPGYAAAHDLAARIHVFAREFPEAIAETRTALELDPLSAASRARAATWLLYAGQFRAAAEIFETLVRQSAEGSFALGNLGLCQVKLGDTETGIQSLRKAIEVATTFEPPRHCDLVYALVQGGRLDEARREAEALLRFREEHGLGTAAVALAFASLGDAESSLKWLEKALEEGSGYLASFGTEFSLDPYRSDPRFVDFFRRAGLPVQTPPAAPP